MGLGHTTPELEALNAEMGAIRLAYGWTEHVCGLCRQWHVTCIVNGKSVLDPDLETGCWQSGAYRWGLHIPEYEGWRRVWAGKADAVKARRELERGLKYEYRDPAEVFRRGATLRAQRKPFTIRSQP